MESSSIAHLLRREPVAQPFLSTHPKIFRPAFLKKPKQPIQKNNGNDSNRIDIFTKDSRDQGRRKKNNDHKILKLCKEQQDGRLFFSFLQFIKSLFVLPFSGFCFRSTPIFVSFKRLLYFFLIHFPELLRVSHILQ